MKTLPTSFYTMPRYANTTMDKADLHELLLETGTWIMANGRMWDINSIAIGAGVYKVTLKRQDYTE